MRRIIATCWMVILSASAYSGETNLRFAKWFQFPGRREVVAVSEGDFEPRSIGSYALRVYGGASKSSPTDDFVTGVTRLRNGTIESVKFASVTGAEVPEIVVITRSVGSGGYLSADAFRYRDRALEWLVTVSDLDKAADPIPALRDKFKASAEKKG
jgi:hypothetical protein